MRKLLLLLTLTGFISFFDQVDAAGANQDLPPNHIKLDNIFTVPPGSNSLVIPDAKGDIIQITDQLTNQKGAIWSTENNLMDLTKDFEASMFIYFGNNGTNAADGMAFVMHNDPRGSATSDIGAGASIGVWDSPTAGQWGKGINQSFAVEFDTHHNDDFDSGLEKRDHIAWNYPGQRNSYNDSGLWPFKKRKLHHKNTQYPGELSVDQWYSFKISWQAATSQLTYQFASLDPVTVTLDPMTTFGTNTNIYWGFTGSTGALTEMNRVVFEQVPGLVMAETSENILDAEGNSILDQEVLIGEKLTYQLTGEYLSGKQDWMNLAAETVISDHVSYVPGTLQLTKSDGTITTPPDSSWDGQHLVVPIGDLDNTITSSTVSFDVTTKEVPEVTQVNEQATFKGQNHLAPGDPVSYTISTFEHSIELKQEGTVQNIPVGQDYTATVEWRSRNVGESVFRPILSDQVGTEFIQENTSPDQVNTFDYTIPSEQLKIGENKLSYQMSSKGIDNEITSGTVILNVNQPPQVTIERAGETINTEPTENYLLKGNWSDQDSTSVSLFYVINKQTPVRFLIDAPNPDKGAKVPFSVTIPNNPRTIRTVTVFAVDSNYFKSVETSLMLNSNGLLKIASIPEKISFTAVAGTNKIRPQDFKVRIEDSRRLPTLSEWKLHLKLLDDFKTGDNKVLAGEVIYTDPTVPNAPDQILIKNQAVNVYTNQTALAEAWDITSSRIRISLNTRQSAYKGVYTSKLEWILEDGP